MSIRRLLLVRGIALTAAVVAAAGCAPMSPAQMTPAQREASELRQYCGTRPERDPERCFVFIGGPGG